MCLVKEEPAVHSLKTVTGWKVVEVVNYNSLYSPIQNYRHRVGSWVTTNEPGFHCFSTRKDARHYRARWLDFADYRIIRVKARKVIAYGLLGSERSFRAEELYIPANWKKQRN